MSQETTNLAKLLQEKLISFVVCLCFLPLLMPVNALLAGPTGDYGDAPVGDNIDGIDAYPGVTSRFVSYYNHKNTVFMPQYDHGSYVNGTPDAYLGTIAPTLKSDTQQDPSLPENDCYPLILLEGTGATPGPNPLATIALDISTTASHDTSQALYLNVFIDQNRDGQWKDGYLEGTPLIAWNLEWVVQDLAIYQSASTTALHTFSYIRLSDPTAPVWVRVILTDQPVGTMYRDYPPAGTGFWDATMPLAASAVGEVEDFLMGYYTPASMPIVGTRGWGIVLRRLLQPGPPPGWTKPDCFLQFIKATYNRPLGDIRPFVIQTPWCPPNPGGGWIDFGLRFKTVSILGGCNPPANALVGLYGYKLVAGNGQKPNIARNALGIATLLAPPMACAIGPPLVLPAVHPDDPIFTLIDGGYTAVTDWKNGDKFWKACYPDPPRYRRWATKLYTKTCGSEITNHPITPGFDNDTNYATITAEAIAIPGISIRIDFVAGGLLEKVEDPDEVIPFPDPDFASYNFYLNSPSGFANTFADNFYSPPLSIFLFNGGYEVNPAIPDDMISTEIEMLHLSSAPGGFIRVKSEEGDSLTFSLPVVTDWTPFTQTLPSDFQIAEVRIEMVNGLFDDLLIGLEPLQPTYPTILSDCNGNGIDDDLDIDDGISEDLNGNLIPDECEEIVEFLCGDANGDLTVDISDAVYLINYAFGGGPAPVPLIAGDANCDGVVDISDAVYIINYAFGGGNPPCDTNNDGIPDC